jgi:hypothetical protein
MSPFLDIFKKKPSTNGKPEVTPNPNADNKNKLEKVAIRKGEIG